MPMLPARHYESEHTKFMRELMERRATCPSSSARRARSGGTRTRVELAADSERSKSRVPMKPYVYSDETPVETLTVGSEGATG